MVTIAPRKAVRAVKPAPGEAAGVPPVVVAMLIVPALDAIAKVLGRDLSPFQIGGVNFAVQTVLLALALTALRRSPLPPRSEDRVSTLVALAIVGGLMAVSIALLFWSFRTLPLANAIAIFFVGPFLIALFSAVFLRERIGWYRIVGIAVGLLGALIVVRPNFAAFGAAALLPLGAATGFAAKQTIVRAMSSRLEPFGLTFWCSFFAALWMGLFLVFGAVVEIEIMSWRAPTGEQWALLAFMGFIAVVVQWLQAFALRLSPASLLAPFQYVEIVGATFYGAILFSELPDALTVVGTLVIIGAGVFVAYRERVRALASAAPTAQRR